MSLKGLPSAVLTMICGSADKNTLMTLRLTDKNISIPATKSFSDRFMNSVSIIMTKACLERLIELCEHPSFGPGIRKIYINSGRMTQGHIQSLVIKLNRLIDDYDPGSEQMARVELLTQRCKDRYNDEHTLTDEGRAAELLTQAFYALETWGHDVELAILPRVYTNDNTIFLDLDCDESLHFDSTLTCLANTLQPCLDAIRISRIEFCKLCVKVKKFATSLEELHFSLDNFSKEDMERFSSLKSLTFELDFAASHPATRAIARIVSQAQELEVFHLSHGDQFPIFHESEGGDTPLRFEFGDNALRSVKSDRIKSLSFTKTSFSKHCLLDFLQKYRNTLETLRFAECALRDGSWTEVISYMRKSLPHLRVLNINSLDDAVRQTPSSPDYILSVSVVGFGKIPVKGEDEVQAVLQAMTGSPLYDPLASEVTEDDETSDDETSDGETSDDGFSDEDESLDDEDPVCYLDDEFLTAIQELNDTDHKDHSVSQIRASEPRDHDNGRSH
jgi:hypothetical protein